MESKKSNKTAMKISLVYILSGITWILFSEEILHTISLNKQMLLVISMVKGWTYVLVTGLLLWFFISKSLNHTRLMNQTLLEKYQELAVSDQKLQEKIQRLTESDERYRLVSEAVNDGIWEEKQGERYFSERWYQITGYSREGLKDIGDWMYLIHPEDIARVRDKLLWHKQNKDANYSCEYRLRFKNGEYRWILSRSRLIFNEQGEIIRSVGSHTDITELKESQERLIELAYNDYLTGLPNRVSFYGAVKEHITDQPDQKKALIFFDIDNFKHINDTIGHVVGDQLLISMAKKLTDLIDGKKSVYRISGDEFIVFIHQFEDIIEVETFAEELISRINSPFHLPNHTLNIMASTGIALYPLHGEDVDSLLQCADMAMYRSKSENRGRYTFYNQNMENRLKESMELASQLAGALDRNEFLLYYQPQLDINTGELCALEALLRWKNDKLGYVPPLQFISIAEETHLINPIGDWVLENACSFLRKLYDQGHAHIRLSVNVSIIQLMQQDFSDKLMKILAHYDIDPGYLELEVTESVYIDSYELIKGKLEDLMSRGLSIALDDFGTGYSSLSYLTQIPINTLKVDKSFIDMIDMEEEDKSLVNMIIMVGRKLGLSVVAEGVETKEQLEYLRKHRCHKAQGYYFSKPLPCEEVISLLGKG